MNGYLDLDRALADEPGIDPSPVFVRSVMAAVEREAAAPPPIPFPWLRALLGAGAALAVVVAFPPALARPAELSAAIDTVARAAAAPAVMWTAIGLLASAASVAVATVRVDR
jgi:hypothetical protein